LRLTVGTNRPDYPGIVPNTSIHDLKNLEY